MACKESPDSDFKERGFTPEEFAKTYWVILEPTSTLKVWQMEGKLNKIRNKILFIRDVEQSQFIALQQMKQLDLHLYCLADPAHLRHQMFLHLMLKL